MQVEHLRPLRLLHTLWLLNNPVASRPDYRASVLGRLPQLKVSRPRPATIGGRGCNPV